MLQLDHNQIYRDFVDSRKRNWGPGGRSTAIGASEVGACARRIWHLKHATTPDAGYRESYGAMERGNLVETFWVGAMRYAFGDKFKGAGAEQRRLRKGYIAATPDGILTELPRDFLKPYGVDDIGEDGSVLTEHKSFDPRKNLTDVQPEHRLQTIVQLGLVRRVTRRRPLYAVVWYTNASWLDDIRVFVVSYDDTEFNVLEQRAARIMTANAAADLPPEGYIAGGAECEHCPWAGQCNVERRRVPITDNAEIDTDFAVEVAALARSAKAIEADIDRLGTELRVVHGDIKDRLRGRDVRRVEANGTKVNWSAVKGRAGWDNAGIRDAAEAAGVDIAAYATQGEPGDRLAITIHGAGGANKASGPKPDDPA